MTPGLLYKCKWNTDQWWSNRDRGWDMLMFLGIETIKRDDGVVIENYRFMDMLTGELPLFDHSLALKCIPLETGEYDERD
jgi:hypothetical protein